MIVSYPEGSKAFTDAVEAFHHSLARASDVDTDESFAGLTVYGAGIDPYPAFIVERGFDLAGCEAEAAAVNPHEICAFQPCDSERWEFGGEE